MDNFITEYRVWREEAQFERERRTAARKAGAPYDAAKDMHTELRAERLARRLFPDEYSDGSNCLAASGLE